MGAIVGDVVSSVEVEHAVKEIGESWNKAVQSIIDTAVLVHQYKNSKHWKDIKEQLIERNIMKNSVMSMMTGIAENGLLTSPDNIPLLPPCYNTLYLLTKLDEDVLQDKFRSGDVHPGLKVEDARQWRKETSDPTAKSSSETSFTFAKITIPNYAEFNEYDLQQALNLLKERFPFIDISFVSTKS
jgi:hypothetical protein